MNLERIAGCMECSEEDGEKVKARTCGHCWRLVGKIDTIDMLADIYECEWCHAIVYCTYEFE